MGKYNEEKMKFGSRLRKLRMEKGYKSQTEFANAYKENFGTIRKNHNRESSMFRTIQSWENGKSVPPCTTLNNLCTLLQCDADYILGRIENSTHDINFICTQTHLKESTIHNLKQISSFHILVDYISTNLIPYSTNKDINKLFNNIQKYIQTSDDKQSALAMLEIQEALTKLKVNIQYQEKNSHKRLF